MKKKIAIFLIIVVTIMCIYAGIKTRENNGIVVTQISTGSNGSLSYMLETNKNNIIMIDGGDYDDSEHLEQILKAKGGVVDRWFITMANPKNFGAFQRILEKGEIKVNGIYISFNTADWYDKYETENYKDIAEFLDLIYSENIIKTVYDVPLKYELLVDNLYISVLNVKNPELNQEYAGFNQSMVIKVNNTYKSMIFMGNIANEAATKFKDNNLDEIDCDAVQISNNNEQNVDDYIYQMMTPNYVFMPTSDEKETYIEHIQNLLNPEKMCINTDEDISIKIW